MVCFDDPELDARARKLSWLGISKDTYSRAQRGTYAWLYDVDDVGFKTHGNSIMAGLALVALRYLDEDNAYRREIAAEYTKLLGDYPWIGMVPTAPNCVSSRHLFQVRLSNRNEVIKLLHQQNIYPGVHYRSNLEYPMYEYARSTCPRATEYSQQILSLPLHLAMTIDDVHRVARVLLDSDQPMM
jgi:dTDP-4-amino-4,6-dideoxygalactose transaminase